MVNMLFSRREKGRKKTLIYSRNQANILATIYCSYLGRNEEKKEHLAFIKILNLKKILTQLKVNDDGDDIRIYIFQK